MAKPREVRGWIVYASGVGVAFLMLAYRFYYAVTGSPSPFLVVEWVDVPLIIGVLAGALAAAGLHQALWYFLVKRDGWTLYGASLLLFLVGTLLLYGLPAHLAQPTFLYLMFTAALVVYVYPPALSYGSKVFTGIAVAGDGALLAASLYGPLTGQAPLTNPVILTTLAAEGVLLLMLLRVLQVTFRAPAASPA